MNIFQKKYLYQLVHILYQLNTLRIYLQFFDHYTIEEIQSEMKYKIIRNKTQIEQYIESLIFATI